MSDLTAISKTGMGRLRERRELAGGRGEEMRRMGSQEKKKLVSGSLVLKMAKLGSFVFLELHLLEGEVDGM